MPVSFGLRRSTTRDSAAKVEQYNPYLAARREWDERYGDQIARARNWRTIAVLCALIALLETGGLLWMSARSRVLPFVVLLDHLGRPVTSGFAGETSTNDDRVKRATIFSWVENLRLVTTDGVAQRKAIDFVYAHIANGSSAEAFINDFYRSDPPSKRAQTQTVSIEVQSVLPTSDRTYEVDWIETTRDLYGAIKATDHWKGSFTIAINPPADERLARINPLGLYVTNASWDQVL
jgi:type IV secretory pathway TrbF-like protein